MTTRDEATGAMPPGDAARRRVEFSALYREHLGSVRAYASACVAATDIDDVASEVFMIALQRQDAIPHEWARGWLIGVARNVVRTRRRSARRRANFLDQLAANRPVPAIGPGDQQLATETFDTLEAAMALLQPSDQELLVFAGPYGMSNGDIAAALEITENNVAVRLHRARQRLRTAYARLAGEGGEVA